MSFTTHIKAMKLKLISAAFGALGTSLGLAVGIATTPPDVEAGGFNINVNQAHHTTAIRTSSNTDTVMWSD